MEVLGSGLNKPEYTVAGDTECGEEELARTAYGWRIRAILESEEEVVDPVHLTCRAFGRGWQVLPHAGGWQRANPPCLRPCEPIGNVALVAPGGIFHGRQASNRTSAPIRIAHTGRATGRRSEAYPRPYTPYAAWNSARLLPSELARVVRRPLFEKLAAAPRMRLEIGCVFDHESFRHRPLCEIGRRILANNAPGPTSDVSLRLYASSGGPCTRRGSLHMATGSSDVDYPAQHPPSSTRSVPLELRKRIPQSFICASLKQEMHALFSSCLFCLGALKSLISGGSLQADLWVLTIGFPDVLFRRSTGNSLSLTHTS